MKKKWISVWLDFKKYVKWSSAAWYEIFIFQFEWSTSPLFWSVLMQFLKNPRSKWFWKSTRQGRLNVLSDLYSIFFFLDIFYSFLYVPTAHKKIRNVSKTLHFSFFFFYSSPSKRKLVFLFKIKYIRVLFIFCLDAVEEFLDETRLLKQMFL